MTVVKVLHVCTVPITARTFIAPLARHLEVRGFHVTIACAEMPDPESGSAMDELRAAGFRMWAVPIPRTLRPLQAMRALVRLRRFMRAERFAIVHTQTAQAGFVGRAAARLAGVPVIIHTAHAFPFHPYQPPAARWLAALLERCAATWADLILVDTDAVRSVGLQFRVARPEKIRTVPMGIDLTRFAGDAAVRASARRKWGIGPTDPVVGTVARMVRDKGLETLLDAAAMVTAARPDVRFLLVGGGPLREALESRARRLGIAPRVIFAGVRSDVPRMLAAMDLFALPTRREGFGVVFAEAMAMEVPVVASDLPAVRTVVGDGEAGVLLPPGDPNRLARVIVELLDDEERRRAMGAAGRRRVVRLFDERESFRRVEAEYHRLLAKKGVSGP